MMVVLMAVAVDIHAFSYDRARSEALFLSDKMAYELNLSTPQYNTVYEINLDYFLCVASRNDIFGNYWERRNYELQRVLTPSQWNVFVRTNYFYRPVSWRDGRWRFGVYGRYHDRSHFYMSRPTGFSNYRGGRYFARIDSRRRVGPGPQRNFAGARPRTNVNRRPGANTRRDNQGRVTAPRTNNLRGNAPRPNVNTPGGRVTRNGYVQRVGGTSRTTVTVRDPNQQQTPPRRNNNQQRRDGNRQNRAR